MFRKKFSGLVICLGLYFVGMVFAAEAASLQFDPTTLNVATGQSFQMKVDIDAGSNEILATDAKITYDSALCTVTGIENGTYFTTMGKADFSVPGQVYIAGIVDNPGDFKIGTGTVATMTVKCNTAGTATFAYVCTAGETGSDSNIANNDFDATDVINCAENGTSRVVIGGSSSTTPAPTSSTTTPTVAPTSAPTSVPAPTSSSLPETGTFDSVMGMGTVLPISIAMVVIGVAVKLILR